MTKRRKARNASIDQRSGGVYISGSGDVRVKGDLVGRDKITQAGDDREFEALFAELVETIRNSQALSGDEKQDLIAKGEELKAELEQPEPDLGKVGRLKQFLLAKGDWITAAVGAVFQYPPVQETLKNAAQRVIGG